MKNMTKIIKALANERRLLILRYLKQEGMTTVTEISEIIKLSFKSTSRHLSILRQVGIVQTEQVRREIFYSINKEIPISSRVIIDLL